RKGDQPNTWAIDEKTGPIVAGIFSDYAEGFSANAIARFLNDAGVASPKNVRWKGQRIGMILDNPIYAGLTQLDEEFVQAQWEGIVGPGLWNTVRERRAGDPRRMHNLGRAKPKQRYLLTGFTYCGVCGSKMTHTRNQRDSRGIYHCAGETWGQWTGCKNMRIPELLADPIVEEQFLSRCAFTILTEAGSRAGSPRQLWKEASLEERRRLLGLVVERVVMTPLDFEVPLMQRATTLGHDVRVVWKNDVADRDEVVIVADPPQPVEQVVRNTRVSRLRATERTPEAEVVAAQPEPARRTPGSWAEHRRERLLPR
ncbi:MAG: recombinase family protein, partial [Actinomycetota bacterium]|nr:recombinase family protein [Actinomycetota bacterium]